MNSMVAAEQNLSCPICHTGKFLTSGVTHQCSGCGYGWKPDGTPLAPVTNGYRQPRLNTGSRHDHPADGVKPSRLSATWLFRNWNR